MFKKILFTAVVLSFVFGMIEIILSVLGVTSPDAPVVIERIMNSDVRYDWLEEDPLVFWKLIGDVPGKTVFRIETLSLAQEKQLCDEFRKQARPGDGQSVPIAPLIVGGTGGEVVTLTPVGTPVSTGDTIPETRVAADKSLIEKPAAPVTSITKAIPVRTGNDAAKKEKPRLSANFDIYDMQPVSSDPAPGTQRIICLGDSCTFFGRPSYPKRLETLLNCDSETAWQVINAGVPAYSSYQGHRLFEHRLKAFEARFVTVYFGWNDHWNARTAPDAVHGANPETRRGLKSIENLFGFLRIDDAISIFYDTVRAQLHRPESKDRVLRVSLSDYRKNLDGIARLAGQKHTRVVFLTAPHGFDRQNPPQYLQDMNYFNDLSGLIETHESYNNCVRDVASETGSILVDLAALVDTVPDRRNLFLQDGIHLSDAGLEFVSRHLYCDIRRNLRAD